MKVYISGKIGEEVLSEATRQKFAKAEQMLKAKGFETFNPTTSGLGAHAESLAKAADYKTTFYQEILLCDLATCWPTGLYRMGPTWSWTSPWPLPRNGSGNWRRMLRCFATMQVTTPTHGCQYSEGHESRSSTLRSDRCPEWGGGKRETLSLPCSRLKAVELRDWTRRMFGHLKVYQDIQIREV